MPSRDRATYVYGRGDYGTEHASDLDAHVVERNCSLGCQVTTEGEEPGMGCPHLLNLYIKEPVPVFDPRPGGIHCDARVPLDVAIVLDGQEVFDL